MFYRQEKVMEPIQVLNKFSYKNNLVFVSGCFDIIHIGHISFLRKAKEVVKENGQLLVVVHDDESIKKKKGENRPINNLDNRIELLCEMECVDIVMPWYGWEDISDFVKNLKPKYIAITSDAIKDKSVAKISNEIGSNLKIIPLIKNFSSSGLLEKFSSEYF